MIEIQSDDFARMSALLQKHGIKFIEQACAAAEAGVGQTVPIRTVAELLALKADGLIDGIECRRILGQRGSGPLRRSRRSAE